ncbi:MAG: hypothetical protein ABIY70_08680 [Capsulimonas sp.]|uniref:hypothetical protein n=1 Tax=Capsulimonas sp. TaxID=2494211 RepID=UPI003263BB72
MTATQFVIYYPNATAAGMALLLKMPIDRARKELRAARAWNAAPLSRRFEGTRKIAALEVGMGYQTVSTSRGIEKAYRPYTQAEIDRNANLVKREIPMIKLQISDHHAVIDGTEDVIVEPCVLGKQLPDPDRLPFKCAHDGIMGEMIQNSRVAQRSAAA